MLTRTQVLQQQLDHSATDIAALLKDDKTVKRLRDNYSLLDLVRLCHPDNLAPVLSKVYPDPKDVKANPYTLWQVNLAIQQT